MVEEIPVIGDSQARTKHGVGTLLALLLSCGRDRPAKRRIQVAPADGSEASPAPTISYAPATDLTDPLVTADSKSAATAALDAGGSCSRRTGLAEIEELALLMQPAATMQQSIDAAGGDAAPGAVVAATNTADGADAVATAQASIPPADGLREVADKSLSPQPEPATNDTEILLVATAVCDTGDIQESQDIPGGGESSVSREDPNSADVCAGAELARDAPAADYRQEGGVLDTATLVAESDSISLGDTVTVSPGVEGSVAGDAPVDLEVSGASDATDAASVVIVAPGGVLENSPDEARVRQAAKPTTAKPSRVNSSRGGRVFSAARGQSRTGTASQNHRLGNSLDGSSLLSMFDSVSTVLPVRTQEEITRIDLVLEEVFEGVFDMPKAEKQRKKKKWGTYAAPSPLLTKPQAPVVNSSTKVEKLVLSPEKRIGTAVYGDRTKVRPTTSFSPTASPTRARPATSPKVRAATADPMSPTKDVAVRASSKQRSRGNSAASKRLASPTSTSTRSAGGKSPRSIK